MYDKTRFWHTFDHQNILAWEYNQIDTQGTHHTQFEKIPASAHLGVKMLYASNLDTGSMIRATHDHAAVCPSCGGPVVAKMGDIVVHHWAHVSNIECDQWHDSETKWHMAWKSRFPIQCVEQRIERDGIWHRADVYLPDGIVIEFQHSSISTVDIEAREKFYQRMIWVLDVKDVAESLEFNRDGQEIKMFWPKPRKSFSVASHPVIMDLGDGRMFTVTRWAKDCYFGWGQFTSRDNFIAKYATVNTPKELYRITLNDIADGKLEQLGYEAVKGDPDLSGEPWRPTLTVRRK